MKKIVLSFTIALALTGCGNKLKCTRTIKNDVMTQKTTYIVYTDKDTITKVEATEKTEVANKEINENYDYLLSFRFEDLNNNNIKYDYSHKKNKYDLKITYDLSTMSEDAITAYIETKNIDEYKTKLSDENFTCK